MNKNMKFVIMVVISVLVAFGAAGCGRKRGDGPDSGILEKHHGAFPIEVTVMRDGRSSVIKYGVRPDGELKELWLVYGRSPGIQGEVYLNESWDHPGAKPLVRDEALKCLDEVEDHLRKYFGNVELEKIVKNTERFNKMTMDELKRSMEDPIIGNRIEASNAMTLVALFRGYIKNG